MPQQDLRTYRRRATTRESGYHTCDETTGSECRIVHAARHRFDMSLPDIFHFGRHALELVEIFDRGSAMAAFGGYVRSKFAATLTMSMSYDYEGNAIAISTSPKMISLKAETWTPIGMHIMIPLGEGKRLAKLDAQMSIAGALRGNLYDFISFDLDVVTKNEFLDATLAGSFEQKTNLHVPHIYYLHSDLPFNTWLTSPCELENGIPVVLKSCNRCGRYLPINTQNEAKTLAYSLHCKNRAPCNHTSFRSYKIMNLSDLAPHDLSGLNVENDRLVTYHGHQLECKACKKFFVNAPLNPQRNSQQFREDGLRRRAIEVLVNLLLKKNFVHFEFERLSRREFSEYIWEKFDKRCFKCGPDSEIIDLEDMALDHTMPLAYLYRLDETATCLCASHNSQKSDHFPVDFYSDEELERLSCITGLPLNTLKSREVNEAVLELLVENVVWFYDEFLMNSEYQKIRDGIKTADKINDSLKRVIAGKVDLAEEYKARKGVYPLSVTII